MTLKYLHSSFVECSKHKHFKVSSRQRLLRYYSIYFGGLTFHENLLLPNNSHEIPNLIWFKKQEKLTKFTSIGSKKGGKEQESIQSSTTPDPGYHMGK